VALAVEILEVKDQRVFLVEQGGAVVAFAQGEVGHRILVWLRGCRAGSYYPVLRHWNGR
jgi:hypothetical protein